MHKRLTIIGLELYALLLTFVQSIGGIRTDEAKYLLNIPYPHPPFVRWILSATEQFPYHELFWRVLFATIVIQAVWFVYDLASHLSKEQRFALCAMWLLSAAVVLQAGTIMMAPLTGVQGLFLLWLYVRKPNLTLAQSGYLALFWLASLFTAYQAILYFPIVIALFWRMKIAPAYKVLGALLPVVLLVIYTPSNPLIPASMLSAGMQNAGAGFDQTIFDVWTIWMLGGSLILSIIGTWGMIRARSWVLISSLVLVLFYVFLSARLYYPILLTPLFVAGVIAAPTVFRKVNFVLALHFLMSMYLLITGLPQVAPSEAWKVMQTLKALQGEYILIQGDFGHQWQYESALPIRRFKTSLLDHAAAVVCLETCAELSHFGWKQVENLSTEVWFNTQKESP